MTETVVIEQKKHYLMLMVKLVPKSLYKDNKKAEASLIRLMMEVFEHGIEFGETGKVEVVL
jgi:hypothetical protein